MRQILPLLFIIISICVISSCSTRGGYNATLCRADSLMNDHPDSAYAILQKASKQDNKRDRAYYDLLITEAKYKVYIPATSDSLINVAVDYFSNNKDREKNTRAMIYKGVVMSELGNAEEAMKWYKRAESNAAKDDYYNLGYSKMRIAELYQNQFIADTTAILKYKEAIPYFRKLNNVDYQLKCLGEIGGMYREYNSDSAFKYITRAVDLSKESSDKSYLFDNYIILSGYYFFKHQYKQAKDIAIYAINNGGEYLKATECYYYASYSYAMLSNIDSAVYYLKKFPQELKPDEKIEYYDIISIIERLKGHKDLYIKYAKLSDNISDSIMLNSTQTQLRDIEQKYDNQGLSLKNEQMRADNNRLALLASIAVIFVLVTLIVIMRYRHKAKVDKIEINSIRYELEQSLEMISAKDDINADLKRTIDSQISITKDLVESSYKYEFDTAKFMKRFRESMTEGKSGSDFLASMRPYVNATHNDMLTRIQSEFPMLTSDDIDVISMVCCNFPLNVMMLYLGYTNTHSVSNKKRLIAKKLGAQTIEDFIKAFK
jgi:tetratricopeptide (TPR) repeat protein